MTGMRLSSLRKSPGIELILDSYESDKNRFFPLDEATGVYLLCLADVVAQLQNRVGELEKQIEKQP